MIWNDSLLDPGTDEFKKSKKEVEEQASLSFLYNQLQQTIAGVMAFVNQFD